MQPYQRSKKFSIQQLLIVILSVFMLFSNTGIAQRSSKAGKTRLNKQSTVPGVVTVNVGTSPGTAQVLLENYTGSPLKAIQFFVISSSANILKKVVPLSPFSDKKQWIFQYNIVPGPLNSSGQKTDTVKVVIFGNGWTVFPSGSSIGLLDLEFEQPSESTTVSNIVTIKISEIVAALPIGESAKINAGSEVSLTLWK